MKYQPEFKMDLEMNFHFAMDQEINYQLDILSI
jgi:hypothetical protein